MTRLLFLFFLVIAGSLGATRGQAEGYTLVPQDQVLIRAMRWDVSSSGFVLWDGLSGEYRIAPDGTLAVPLAGHVIAAGETVESLAQQLATQLQREVGLAEAPQLAIELVGHLPIYVLGTVTTPGAYTYRPGLTAEQAVALAGGILRLPPGTPGTSDRQILQIGGEMRLLSEQLADLRGERDRIRTDLTSLSDGEEEQEESGNQDATSGPGGDLLAATQSARQSQARRIRDLQNVLSEQIVRLEEQIALRDSQIEMVREELEAVSSLKERGLAANTRVTGISSNLSNLQAQRIQLDIARLTAAQQLNLAQRDELALTDTARTEGLRELDGVEREIAALEIQLDTARALYSNALTAGLPVDVDPAAVETTIGYQATRAGNAIPLEPTDLLQPGDTLHVSRLVTPTTTQ